MAEGDYGYNETGVGHEYATDVKQRCQYDPRYETGSLEEDKETIEDLTEGALLCSQLGLDNKGIRQLRALLMKDPKSLKEKKKQETKQRKKIQKECKKKAKAVLKEYKRKEKERKLMQKKKMQQFKRYLKEKKRAEKRCQKNLKKQEKMNEKLRKELEKERFKMLSDQLKMKCIQLENSTVTQVADCRLSLMDVILKEPPPRSKSLRRSCSSKRSRVRNETSEVRNKRKPKFDVPPIVVSRAVNDVIHRKLDNSIESSYQRSGPYSKVIKKEAPCAVESEEDEGNVRRAKTHISLNLKLERNARSKSRSRAPCVDNLSTQDSSSSSEPESEDVTEEEYTLNQKAAEQYARARSKRRGPSSDKVEGKPRNIPKERTDNTLNQKAEKYAKARSKRRMPSSDEVEGKPKNIPKERTDNTLNQRAEQYARAKSKRRVPCVDKLGVESENVPNKQEMESKDIRKERGDVILNQKAEQYARAKSKQRVPCVKQKVMSEDKSKEKADITLNQKAEQYASAKSKRRVPCVDKQKMVSEDIPKEKGDVTVNQKAEEYTRAKSKRRVSCGRPEPQGSKAGSHRNPSMKSATQSKVRFKKEATYLPCPDGPQHRTIISGRPWRARSRRTDLKSKTC
ncbi:nuclear speckle splicing regulatory protein 1-like isoform X1 [Diaphorina citri]|uniref:Nuclear speckle splicing regulatory protein 1-like isoform X1 n=1 Tax=Diaphorina citri TaxID=121845 RepID=A0A3Q0IN64_DIACI|nr:nuclear speckle splicing regulatory protein 1-like isoform X1 [Diaphorina citri]